MAVWSRLPVGLCRGHAIFSVWETHKVWRKEPHLARVGRRQMMGMKVEMEVYWACTGVKMCLPPSQTAAPLCSSFVYIHLISCSSAPRETGFLFIGTSSISLDCRAVWTFQLLLLLTIISPSEPETRALLCLHEGKKKGILLPSPSLYPLHRGISTMVISMFLSFKLM